MVDYDTYDAVAQDYARHRRAHPEVLRALFTACHPGDGVYGVDARVLEVGCGTGNYITRLALTTGRACYGLDPSARMLRQAQGQAARVRYVRSRAEATGFAGAQFDLLFSVDVIHHVADLRAYHAEAARIIKPGGLICTVTDSEWIIRNRVPLSTYFPATVEPELRRYPPIPLLRDEMQRAGFNGVREQTVEFLYELTDAATFRARTYSSLHLIKQWDFELGLARMERDLADGPIQCVSRYVLLWGRR